MLKFRFDEIFRGNLRNSGVSPPGISAPVDTAYTGFNRSTTAIGPRRSTRAMYRYGEKRFQPAT